MKIIKRNGNIECFDLNKIKNAIKKAMMSIDNFNEEILNKVTNEVFEEIKEEENL